MARIVLFLFALLAPLVVVLASPVPVHDIQVLEKRVQHTGRVSVTSFPLFLCTERS